jgi:hypothetical protein
MRDAARARRRSTATGSRDGQPPCGRVTTSLRGLGRASGAPQRHAAGRGDRRAQGGDWQASSRLHTWLVNHTCNSGHLPTPLESRSRRSGACSTWRRRPHHIHVACTQRRERGTIRWSQRVAIHRVLGSNCWQPFLRRTGRSRCNRTSSRRSSDGPRGSCGTTPPAPTGIAIAGTRVWPGLCRNASDVNNP